MAQFVRHVRRYILRPAFGCVEADDPNRVFVLAFDKIDDHGFQIGSLNVGFPVALPIAAKIVDHETF